MRVHKDLALADCQLKFSGADGAPTRFSGYASVWGRVDSYGDTVVRGAFVDTLKDRARAPMMLYGHSPGRVIGKWLSLEEDDKGLKVDGELTPGHTEAANVAASLKHGAITGLSIGGYTKVQENLQDGGRVIKAFDLMEISVVSMPAEDEARVETASVKAALEECETVRDIERLLRDVAGLSSAKATALVSTMRKVLQRDAAAQAAVEKEAEQARQLAALFHSVAFPQLKTSR